MSDIHEESRKWFDDKFKNSDVTQLYKAAEKKYAHNHALAESRKGMVFDQGVLVPENKEYIARNEAVKDLRKQLKTYSGSNEMASDLLFERKKRSDELGLDFTQTARAAINEMKGLGIDDGVIIPPKSNKPEPQKPLAGRILHALWKMGFPVGRFIKKGLDVDTADQATQ